MIRLLVYSWLQLVNNSFVASQYRPLQSGNVRSREAFHQLEYLVKIVQGDTDFTDLVIRQAHSRFLQESVSVITI